MAEARFTHSVPSRQSNELRSLNSRYSLISIAFERYCLAICHSGATVASIPLMPSELPVI